MKMGQNRHYQFTLGISPDDYAKYYEGVVTEVQVETYSGLILRFPASVLRKYLTHNGIHGAFEMEVDQNDKFVSIRNIDKKQDGFIAWEAN